MAEEQALSLTEMKALIKEEGLKIKVKKDADPASVFADIQAKREALGSQVEKPIDAPECFGEFVKSGAKLCRKCFFAQECK